MIQNFQREVPDWIYGLLGIRLHVRMVTQPKSTEEKKIFFLLVNLLKVPHNRHLQSLNVV